jgi:hypothetical protein
MAVEDTERLMDRPALRLAATVLGTPDPRGLAEFYSQLLDWPITFSEPDWVMIKPPDGVRGLSFQLEETHVPPVWPQGPGDQQMQLHLDIEAPDGLDSAVEFALSLGAREASFQPQQNVRVLLDPAGHPFCLFKD